MRRTLFVFLFLAACTRHGAAPATDAGVVPVVPEPAPHPTPKPPADEPVPLAADGGLGALLSGAATASRLPETATEGDAGFDRGVRERLTTVEDEGARGEVTIGEIVSKPTLGNADRVLAGLRPRIRACYNAGLRSEPSMKGKVTIEATVTPTGDVPSPTVASNVGMSAPVAACVAGVFRRAGFPPTPTPSTLSVTLMFATKK